MRFASLGSGSQGNSLIVDAGDTKLLLDCGFSTRTAVKRLAKLAISPEEITGILVTHEHSDHIAGVFRFASRYHLPVYLSHGSFLALQKGGAGETLPAPCHIIDCHTLFSIRDIEIQPFPVPHDAREPVQYSFSNGLHRLGVLTDSGMVTPHIKDVLNACDALVLECNHDTDLLATSKYPASLKRRIAGKLGHLSNDEAAYLLREIDTQKLQHIVAAHLSVQNNRPELAVQALASALNCAQNWIGLANQEEGFGWRALV